jgi:hypothetical protein
VARNAPPDPIAFPTKVDRWLAILFASSLGFGLTVSVAAALAEPRSALLSLGAMLGTIGLVALLALPTRYELHAAELVIRSGVIRYRVPYAAITSVAPSHNPLSAPAWSLDRLRIDYGKRFALISPKDREGFLRELQRRVPALGREGERLVR